MMIFTGTNRCEDSNDQIYDKPFPIEVSFTNLCEKRDSNDQAN